MSAFRMVDTVLNTATEDIGVTVLGGAWFVLIGREMLRQGGRMVGIISHVGALRERIRQGIEVIGGERGSRVVVGAIGSPASL